jgi:hypothetical protein
MGFRDAQIELACLFGMLALGSGGGPVEYPHVPATPATPTPRAAADVGCDFRAFSPDRHIRPEPLVRKDPRPYAHCYRREGDARGEVVIRILVSHEGQSRRLCLVQGTPLCAPPAIDAAREWRFQPWNAKSRRSHYAVYDVKFRFVTPPPDRPPAKEPTPH